ncbi:MAG: hypothetical protein ACREJO_16095 [Phycisphaerales bacterium]
MRDLIESIASPRLEAGFGMATLNKRGTHTVGPTGEAERKLRDDFRAFAERVLHKHPRTAALINRVAEHYDGEANDRDKDGRLAEFEDM